MAHNHETNKIDLAGASVVAAVEFHSTKIFRIDEQKAGDPERITPHDPRGLAHNVYHHHGNPDGTYEADNDEYWRMIGEALAPAERILLLGNGTGKANASEDLVKWLDKHMSSVAAKIVGDERANLSALTDEQVLRAAQAYFGDKPVRDYGDSRRGEPR